MECRRRWGAIVLAPLVLLLVSACSHTRMAANQLCAYRALPLQVGSNHAQAPGAPGAPESTASRPRTFQDALARSFIVPRETRRARADAPVGRPVPRPVVRSNEFAVLSGGSQNGAFGGGLFIGLGDLGQVPEYDIVTGVSTGSLQSTMVFLATQPWVADRVYPSDQGERRFGERESNLHDMGIALSISEERTLLDVGRIPQVSAIKDGSMSDLAPLRARLLHFISEGTLRQIKTEKAKVTEQRPFGRQLFVGVTDLDDGRGYAIDLTELASRIDTGDWTPDTLRACYVDALIASSAVPLAAYPVSLNFVDEDGGAQTHMFVDGGVRFGVFLKQLGDAVLAAEAAARTEDEADWRQRRDEAAAAGRPEPARPAATVTVPNNVTVVVNGRLFSRDWLIEDEADTRVPRRRVLRPTWNTLDLVERSVDLLTNQIYRFSVDEAERFPLRGGTLRMAFISNQYLEKLGTDPGDHEYSGWKVPDPPTPPSCSNWTRYDDTHGDPLEFHPHYMACLLDYGYQRGQRDPWNLVIRSTPSGTVTGVPPATAR